MGTTQAQDRSQASFEWATYYVEALGWYVFPIRPGTKAPLSDPSLGLKRGFKDATNDPEHIVEIWSRYPTAGVAVATGADSGLVVVDIDPRNDGEAGLTDLQRDHGGLPAGPLSLTGGGGFHQLFLHPGPELRCRTHLGGYSGVDLKADGGYIVAPPSLHPSGNFYAWSPGRHPIAAMIPPLPDFVAKLANDGEKLAALAYSQSDWDGHLPMEAVRLIACSKKIHSRFHRDASGLNDWSPSGIDYSLACQLAVCGLSPESIEATLKASRQLAGLQLGRASYYRSTVGKALTLAEHTEEEGS
jgi:hypothetical protein